MRKALFINDTLLILITGIISIVSFLYFYSHGHQNLSYYDAIARLNTARKMVDSITPGIGQLGGIWLPLPQILFIPFITNNFLWHSGIAGYIISGIVFIVAAVFLQKLVFLLTEDRLIALLIWFIFVSNINVILLQTMAMSEPFFLCFFILTLYYLVRWTKQHRITDLMLTAFSVMLLTLTRYEGDFVLVGVCLAIFIECLRVYTLREKEKIEGVFIFFITLAGFGIFLWCIYSALFYKDPLFWLHSYANPTTAAVFTNNSVIDRFYGTPNPTLLQSLYIYSSVILWTNGVIIGILSLLGMILYLFKPARLYSSLFIITFIVYIFLVFGYFKGLIPLIEFPFVLLKGTNIRDWSLYADNNVRYGIILLPCILLFLSFLAKKSNLFLSIIFIAAIVQVFFSFADPMKLQYSFYNSWKYPSIVQVPWFRSHYDGGLVLIAASRHEDFIFQSGLPYRDYIYEGTRNYWTDSLNQPSKHASWVIFDKYITGDDVTLGLTKQAAIDLENHYTLVYQRKGFRIYKLTNI